jgi:ribosomal protein S14
MHLDWTSLACNNTGDQTHSVDKIEISRTLSTDLLKKSRQQVRTIAGMAPCPGFSP